MKWIIKRFLVFQRNVFWVLIQQRNNITASTKNWACRAIFDIFWVCYSTKKQLLDLAVDYHISCFVHQLLEKLILRKLYRFELLFFDGTVLTGKFCVGVPLNIQSIYLSIYVSMICSATNDIKFIALSYRFR